MLPLEISNALNSHFTHVGPRLANNIPLSSDPNLGPLLFLIYINDLQECELSSSVLMYADDK